MLPTRTRLEVAVEILTRIQERRVASGDPLLGTAIEERIVQRELELLELEWLNSTAAEVPDTGARPQKRWGLFDRWFGRH